MPSKDEIIGLASIAVPPTDPLEQYLLDHENDMYMNERREIEEVTGTTRCYKTSFNPFPRRHLEPLPSECGRLGVLLTRPRNRQGYALLAHTVTSQFSIWMLYIGHHMHIIFYLHFGCDPKNLNQLKDPRRELEISVIFIFDFFSQI